MFTKTTIAILAAVGSLAGQAQALGINCRGSGVCPLATFQNSNSDSVMELLRYAVLDSPLSNSTMYNSGDHITCIGDGTQVNFNLGASAPIGKSGATVNGGFSFGGTAHTGGICLFPQSLKEPLSLGSARELIDKLIDHGCGTCGSVPVHFADQGSNDPSDGILTFNYVSHPSCIGNCIDPAHPTGPTPAPAPATTAGGTRRARAVLDAQEAAEPLES